MFTEKLIELVENTDSLNQMQRNVTKGWINRMSDVESIVSAERKLIKDVTKEENFEVIISTDEVKIYKISEKSEWDVKYPYRSIFLNNKGVWESIAIVSATVDVAYLVYLEKKYDGNNSQFSSFAMKMLGIKTEE